MADINITEEQYSVVKQPYRDLYCRVNLLNYLSSINTVKYNYIITYYLYLLI